MRNGKTLLGANIWYIDFYPRIYSNFDIYHKGESVLTKLLKTYQEVERIRFSYKHGVIIIDEGGLNVNSKDGFSETSRIMQKVLFLAWKKNCSVIFLAQRYNSVDINFRELSDAIFECTKYSRKNNHPIFYIKRYKQSGTKFEFQANFEVDTIWMMKTMDLTYNTLEESNMKNEKTVKDED